MKQIKRCEKYLTRTNGNSRRTLLIIPWNVSLAFLSTVIRSWICACFLAELNSRLACCRTRSPISPIWPSSVDGTVGNIFAHFHSLFVRIFNAIISSVDSLRIVTRSAASCHFRISFIHAIHLSTSCPFTPLRPLTVNRTWVRCARCCLIFSADWTCLASVAWRGIGAISQAELLPLTEWRWGTISTISAITTFPYFLFRGTNAPFSPFRPLTVYGTGACPTRFDFFGCTCTFICLSTLALSRFPLRPSFVSTSVTRFTSTPCGPGGPPSFVMLCNQLRVSHLFGNAFTRVQVNTVWRSMRRFQQLSHCR